MVEDVAAQCVYAWLAEDFFAFENQPPLPICEKPEKPGTDGTYSHLIPDSGKRPVLFECISVESKKGSPEGYYAEIGEEAPHRRTLADWMSIHLDIIAQDRGLQRLATSLYHL